MINHNDDETTLELNRFGHSIIDHIDTKDYSLMYNGVNMFRELQLNDNIVENNLI
jgi:hypothetical protein